MNMLFTKKWVNTVKLALKNITLISLLFLPNVSFAVEQKLDKESTLFDQTFSWQTMLGVSVFSVNSPLKDVKQEDIIDYLSVSLLIDLYYKGFFIQSNHRRSIGLTQGAELGYQLHVNDDWALDILTKTYITGYDPQILIDRKGENIPTLKGLKKRDPSSGIALRYSKFHDDSILSFDLARVISWDKTSGWLIDTYYNELFIYKNWDIYIGGGVTFYSDDVMNYYYGVKEEEVTPARSFYEPNTGFKASFEIYTQYPISKKWSFNAGITQTYYSNTIIKSPLIDKQHITQFLLGVLYVF